MMKDEEKDDQVISLSYYDIVQISRVVGKMEELMTLIRKS